MSESTTHELEVKIVVVFTPWDDALGAEGMLRKREEAIQTVCGFIRQKITEHVPPESACSLVLGFKQVSKEEIFP